MLNFSGCWVVEAQGHSGGLVLMWKNDGSCLIRDSGTHFIDFEVENDQIGRWRYTGFYGCPERGRRRESWSLLRDLAGRSNLPWCVIGDFNDMMYASEKLGGNEHPQSLLAGFVQTLTECRLHDLGFIGDKYTWEKARGTNYWVRERLDRGVATQTWCDLFPEAEIKVLDVAPSDHLPLSLQLNKKVYMPKTKRFRFENVWVREEECLNLVRNSWESTEGEDIMSRIQFCCLKLEEWGGGVKQDFQVRMVECRKKLRIFRSRRDKQGAQMYNAVRWEYLNLLEKQEIYWKQRSKQFWLREGDRNTRFFHRYASKRRQKNNIQRIKNSEGEWKETTEEVQEVITDYFTNLFASSTGGGTLSHREQVETVTNEENEILMADVTAEEVKNAAFSMHPEKSPGPDGLNPAFFQVFWSVVGEDVVKLCQQFIRTGELPDGINRTVVCLIPKVKQPSSMTELRPISLCNVVIRILSKVLSNRLKACLGNIISEKQSAFIEGRLLTDNALVAFEINHYMKRKTQGKHGVAGLKIDISKAYDRLEWGFVESMMRKFGFSENWIDRIMQYIRSVSYSFLHNGNEFGSVIPQRGLRQGDPISPYLYIMCAEGLSAIIRRNEHAGLLHGCSIARGAPIISHLLFADDCYFFFRANGGEAGVMKRILSRYEELSGQMVNYNKSTIVFSPNTNASNRREVCDQLEVDEVHEPGNYLGLPMRVGRGKIATFKFLQDRVEQKLQGWRNQPISKAGKVTLLKTAAQVIPNFWMSLLLIPMDICDSIEKRMNAFWWCNDSSGGGIRWMAWDRLCEAKEGGGLGFKRLKEFNVAMLAKQGWRLLNNANPLVTNLMKAKYYPNGDFLNAKLGDNPSYVWRSIMEAQEVIKEGCRRKIGDGKSTRVWEIPWLPCPSNGYLTTRMPVELRNATVSSLMDESRGVWDEDVLNDICNDRDRALIRTVPISSTGRADSWFWNLEDKGQFTVRSCYRRIHGEREYIDRVFWRKMWSLKLPGKVTNFLWRACRNCLPTTDALHAKHVDVDLMCAWCRCDTESAVHVLFRCEFAQAVWLSAGLQSVSTLLPHDTVMTVLQRFFATNHADSCAMVGLLCWGLWYRRNQWVWERVSQSVFGLKAMVCSMQKDWKKVEEEARRKQGHGQQGDRTWSKPPTGWVKINVDAACKPTSGFAGTGCVVRDDRGRFLRARSNVIAADMQPRMAEALSLQEALSWIKAWRSSRCIFESDSKILVDAVNGSEEHIGNSYFDTIVGECRELVKHFDEVLIVFVYRSANTIAHKLARATYPMSGLQQWLSTAPDFISCNLLSEEL